VERVLGTSKPERALPICTKASTFAAFNLPLGIISRAGILSDGLIERFVYWSYATK